MEVFTTEKKTLDLLLQWKRRLLSASEKDINECFLNVSELLSLIPFTNDDTPSRRSGLYVIEKLTLSCWQHTQYGKKQPQSSHLFFIEAVYPIVEKLAEGIKFDANGFWFGGTDINRTEKFNSNKSAFVSLCLHLAALSTYITSSSSVASFLSSLTRFYGKTYEFSMELIEHDERCLSTVVALMHISNAKIPLPDQYNPREIIMCIFMEINFDYSVVLDWLNSEIVAIPFMLRFLKDLQIHPELYNPSFIDTTSRRVASPKFRRGDIVDDEAFSLKIYEEHGEKLVETVFEFPKTEARAYFTDTDDVICKRSYSIDNLIGLINELHCICSRLMEKNIAPFNMTRLISEMSCAKKATQEMTQESTKLKS